MPEELAKIKLDITPAKASAKILEDALKAILDLIDTINNRKIKLHPTVDTSDLAVLGSKGKTPVVGGVLGKGMVGGAGVVGTSGKRVPTTGALPQADKTDEKAKDEVFSSVAVRLLGAMIVQQRSGNRILLRILNAVSSTNRAVSQKGNVPRSPGVVAATQVGTRPPTPTNTRPVAAAMTPGVSGRLRTAAEVAAGRFLPAVSAKPRQPTVSALQAAESRQQFGGRRTYPTGVGSRETMWLGRVQDTGKVLPAENRLPAAQVALAETASAHGKLVPTPRATAPRQTLDGIIASARGDQALRGEGDTARGPWTGQPSSVRAVRERVRQQQNQFARDPLFAELGGVGARKDWPAGKDVGGAMNRGFARAGSTPAMPWKKEADARTSSANSARAKSAIDQLQPELNRLKKQADSAVGTVAENAKARLKRIQPVIESLWRVFSMESGKAAQEATANLNKLEQKARGFGRGLRPFKFAFDELRRYGRMARGMFNPGRMIGSVGGSAIGFIRRLPTLLMRIPSMLTRAFQTPFRLITKLRHQVWNLVFLGGLLAGAAYSGIKALGPAGTREEWGKQFSLLQGEKGKGFENQLETGTAPAQERIAWLAQYSEQLRYTVEQTVEAGRVMTTFGMFGKAAFKTIADAASAYRVSLHRVVESLGRVKTGAFGMAMRSLRLLRISKDRLEKEGISFKGSKPTSEVGDILKTIISIWRQDVGGMAEAMADTFKTKLVTLGDTFRNAMARSFAGMLPYAKTLIDFLKSGVSAVGDIIAKYDWSGVGTKLYSVIAGIGSVGLKLTNKEERKGMQGRFGKFAVGMAESQLVMRGGKAERDAVAVPDEQRKAAMESPGAALALALKAVFRDGAVAFGAVVGTVLKYLPAYIVAGTSKLIDGLRQVMRIGSALFANVLTGFIGAFTATTTLFADLYTYKLNKVLMLAGFKGAKTNVEDTRTKWRSALVTTADNEGLAEVRRLADPEIIERLITGDRKAQEAIYGSSTVSVPGKTDEETQLGIWTAKEVKQAKGAAQEATETIRQIIGEFAGGTGGFVAKGKAFVGGEFGFDRHRRFAEQRPALRERETKRAETRTKERYSEWLSSGQNFVPPVQERKSKYEEIKREELTKRDTRLKIIDRRAMLPTTIAKSYEAEEKAKAKAQRQARHEAIGTVSERMGIPRGQHWASGEKAIRKEVMAGASQFELNDPAFLDRQVKMRKKSSYDEMVETETKKNYKALRPNDTPAGWVSGKAKTPTVDPVVKAVTLGTTAQEKNTVALQENTAAQIAKTPPEVTALTKPQPGMIAATKGHGIPAPRYKEGSRGRIPGSVNQPHPAILHGQEIVLSKPEADAYENAPRFQDGSATKPVPLQRIQSAVRTVETGGEADPWIRTRSIPAGGSTAYGPYQITTTKAADYAERYPDKFAGLTDFVRLYSMQGDLFKRFGNVEGQSNPMYDYGKPGFIAQKPEWKAQYERMAGVMMQIDLERAGGDVKGFSGYWHSNDKEKSASYTEKLTNALTKDGAPSFATGSAVPAGRVPLVAPQPIPFRSVARKIAAGVALAAGIGIGPSQDAAAGTRIASPARTPVAASFSSQKIGKTADGRIPLARNQATPAILHGGERVLAAREVDALEQMGVPGFKDGSASANVQDTYTSNYLPAEIGAGTGMSQDGATGRAGELEELRAIKKEIQRVSTAVTKNDAATKSVKDAVVLLMDGFDALTEALVGLENEIG